MASEQKAYLEVDAPLQTPDLQFKSSRPFFGMTQFSSVGKQVNFLVFVRIEFTFSP